MCECNSECKSLMTKAARKQINANGCIRIRFCQMFHVHALQIMSVFTPRLNVRYRFVSLLYCVGEGVVLFYQPLFERNSNDLLILSDKHVILRELGWHKGFEDTVLSVYSGWNIATVLEHGMCRRLVASLILAFE